MCVCVILSVCDVPCGHDIFHDLSTPVCVCNSTYAMSGVYQVREETLLVCDVSGRHNVLHDLSVLVNHQTRVRSEQLIHTFGQDPENTTNSLV